MTPSDRGQSRLLANRSVFFSVFTLPIAKRRAIHAIVIVVTFRRRSAMRALFGSVLGLLPKSFSDHFRRANSSRTNRSALSSSPSFNSAP